MKPAGDPDELRRVAACEDVVEVSLESQAHSRAHHDVQARAATKTELVLRRVEGSAGIRDRSLDVQGSQERRHAPGVILRHGPRRKIEGPEDSAAVAREPRIRDVGSGSRRLQARA